MRRLLPHLLIAGTAVGLFAGGLFLGDARRDDPMARLAVGEPAAVSPVRSEPPVALDEDGYPVDTESSGAGSAGDEEPDADEAGAEIAPESPFQLIGGSRGSASVPSSTAGDDGGADPADPEGGDDGDGSSEDERESAPPLRPVEDPGDLAPGPDEDEDRLRFTDPCAGPTPGSDGGEDCPDGMGGSILIDDDVPTAPALTIDDPWMGPIYMPGAEARCPFGVDPDGTVHAFVLTNVPATLTLSLDVRGEHHEVTAETSPEESLRFSQRLLDGQPIDGFQANAVQTCVTFESLPRSLASDGAVGSVYWYKPAITGVDDLGNEISHPAGFLQMRIRDDEGYLDEFADDADLSGEAPEVDFAAGAVHFARWGGVSPRCRRIGPADGRLHGTLLTTAPGTFDLAVIDRGERIEIGTWTTPNGEIRLHEELMASGETPAVVGPAAVQTCFHMSGIDNPGRYYLEISGETESGEPASARVPFTITERLADELPSETAGRPATMTLRDGEQVNILVTYDESEETVVARGLPRNGPDATGDDCTAIEEDALRHVRSDRHVDTSASPVSRSLFDLFGSPRGADPRFDTVQPIRVTPGEGGVIDVCIWIYTKPDGDFDPTVEQREMIHIESPQNLRISIDLEYLHASSVDLFGPDSLVPTEARRYRITALNWPGQPARLFPPSDLDGFGNWSDDCGSMSRCSEPALTLLSSGDRRIPDVTRLRIEELEHGHVIEAMLPTPNSCLVGRPSGVGGPVCSFGVAEEHYIDLPDNEGTWCINDCHGRRFIQVAVRPEVGPGGPPPATPRAEGEGWVLRNEGSFDRTTLSTPVTPRIDLSVNTPTARIANPGERPTGTLVLPFDRPMDVTVVPVLHEPIPETCALPAGQSSAGALARHTFTFPDLCFGAHYTFDVTAVDPVGGGRLDLPGVAFTLLTPQYPVQSVVAELVMSDAARMEALDWDATVYVGGQQAVFGPRPPHRAGCLDPGTAVEGGDELTRSTGGPALGDVNQLRVEITWRTCDGERHSIEAGRAIGLDDLLAGPVTYAAADGNISMELTITTTASPGYPAPSLPTIGTPP